MKITKAYLEKELIRLKQRQQETNSCAELISLDGSILTIRKLLNKIKD